MITYVQASSARGLSPWDVALEPGALLFDIRSAQDRWGLHGFLPSSLHVPLQPRFVDELVRARDLIEKSEMIVLVCLQGAQSRMLHQRCPTLLNKDVYYLQGGVEEWRAAKLPVAGLQTAVEGSLSIDSAEDIFRALGANFVAEIVEISLDRGEELSFNPLSLLRDCFQAEGVDPVCPDLLDVRRVLDRLALHHRYAGANLARVARILDTMLLSLPTPS